VLPETEADKLLFLEKFWNAIYLQRVVKRRSTDCGSPLCPSATLIACSKDGGRKSAGGAIDHVDACGMGMPCSRNEVGNGIADIGWVIA
jgi:hypothetical protein